MRLRLRGLWFETSQSAPPPKKINFEIVVGGCGVFLKDG
jgi:hypothetical protein